jgi:hypothetical protein
MKKKLTFIVLTFLVVPYVAFAQSPAGSQRSIDSLSIADVADESIVMLSTDQSGVAGYVHQQYAFFCSGRWEVVDYYGAPIDPKDQEVLLSERRMCSQRTFSDDGSDE